MISYLIGKVAQVSENTLILEVNQVGYEIFIPGQVAEQLPSNGELIKIHTYFHVREDVMQLYGFLTKDDLAIFKLLINVNGIGPKAGIGILSVLTTDDIRFAILSDDVNTITKAPGIGKKTAQKLILELKDKFSLEDAFGQKLAHNQEESSLSTGSAVDAKGEAVQALVALGYSNSDALRAVKQVDITPEMDAEMILKASLKKLSFL